MKQCKKDSLLQIYSEHNKKVFDFYKYCQTHKPKKKNGIIYAYQELKKRENYDRLPEYIKFPAESLASNKTFDKFFNGACPSGSVT